MYKFYQKKYLYLGFLFLHYAKYLIRTFKDMYFRYATTCSYTYNT